MSLRDVLVAFSIDVDQSQLVEAQKSVNSLVIRLAQLQRIAGFALAAMGVGAVVESADALINLENRLKAVTNSTAEFESAQRGVVRISRETFSPIQDIANLFQRYSQVTTKLGLAQEEVLDFTHRLTQATKLSGASGSETRGALIQLAQGIGTNFKASGQEIRSIQEQAPELAKIIAKAAGGTTDELMAMAKAGKITSKLVVDAVRNAGPELDRAWAKRTKSFEDISNRFSTEWLMLVKQMLPTIAKIIDKLGDLVQWTQEWVEKGEAMNTLIAAMIIVVGALTFAFGGLIVELLLFMAPFVALYLVIQDFVTFMRGGDSIIGRFFDKLFGVGGAENARQKIGEFLSWITDPSRWADTFKGFYDSMVLWIGQGVEWAKTKIAELGDTISTKLRESLGDTLADGLGIAKPGQREFERGMSPHMAAREADQEEYNYGMEHRDGTQGSRFNDVLTGKAEVSDQASVITDFKEAIVTATRAFSTWMTPEFKPDRPSWDPMSGMPAPTASGTATITQSSWRPEAAPQITNQITVQGNATSAVAREIADKTGTATAASLGRDRSAVGAAFGI